MEDEEEEWFLDEWDECSLPELGGLSGGELGGEGGAPDPNCVNNCLTVPSATISSNWKSGVSAAWKGTTAGSSILTVCHLLIGCSTGCSPVNLALNLVKTL